MQLYTQIDTVKLKKSILYVFAIITQIAIVK